MEKYKKDISKIYLVVGAGVLLLTIMLSVLVYNGFWMFEGSDNPLLLLTIAVLCLGFAGFLIIILLLRSIIHALLRKKQLFELSHHDGVTGLFNHAYMESLLDHELLRIKRYGHMLSLLMFDIDNLNHINTTYGRKTADKVVSTVGQLLNDMMRDSDLAARYGGGEFLVFLPETDADKAAVMAERLLTSVPDLMVETKEGELHVTVSVGLVSYDPKAIESTSFDIVRTAENAMHKSKSDGGDRITAVTLPA